MELLLEGVRVSSALPDFTKDEALCYIAQARKALGKQPRALCVEDAGGGMVRVEWETNGEKFERIRRITG